MNRKNQGTENAATCNDTTPMCGGFLNDTCKLGNECKYVHDFDLRSTAQQHWHQKAHDDTGESVPQLSNRFETIYQTTENTTAGPSVIKIIEKVNAPCQDWQVGKCTWGDKCNYQHEPCSSTSQNHGATHTTPQLSVPGTDNVNKNEVLPIAKQNRKRKGKGKKKEQISPNVDIAKNTQEITEQRRKKEYNGEQGPVMHSTVTLAMDRVRVALEQVRDPVVVLQTQEVAKKVDNSAIPHGRLEAKEKELDRAEASCNEMERRIAKQCKEIAVAEEAIRISRARAQEEARRIARERVEAETRRVAREKADAEARIAKERAVEEARKVARERAEEKARIAKERVAEEARRIARERVEAEARRVARARVETEARIAKERAAEEARMVARERAEEKARIAKERVAEEARRIAQERAAARERVEAEEARRVAQERVEEIARIVKEHAAAKRREKLQLIYQKQEEWAREVAMTCGCGKHKAGGHEAVEYCRFERLPQPLPAVLPASQESISITHAAAQLRLLREAENKRQATFRLQEEHARHRRAEEAARWQIEEARRLAEKDRSWCIIM